MHIYSQHQTHAAINLQLPEQQHWERKHYHQPVLKETKIFFFQTEKKFILIDSTHIPIQPTIYLNFPMSLFHFELKFNQ